MTLNPWTGLPLENPYMDLYEVVNLLWVFSILFIVLIYLKLDIVKSTLLILHLSAIYLLNDILFPASYMSDQFRYMEATQAIRKGEMILTSLNPHDLVLTSGVGLTGSIFALAPIPFINSVRSMAMVNFLIILFLFVFLKKKRISNNAVDFFFLLYPSLLLYSSLALRDTIIFLFMFMSIYYFLLKRNFLLFLIFSAPLIVLKFQNFLIICFSIVLFYFIKGGFRFYKILLTAFSLFLFYLLRDVPIERFTLGEAFSLNTLESMRYALFAENYGYDYSIVEKLGYNPANSIPEFILISMKGLFRFVLAPFIWSAENPFQLIQSLENIVIFVLIVVIVFSRKYFKETREMILYLNLFLIIGLSIYGFAVYNLGSVSRYKFAFIGVYMLLSYYIIKRDNLLGRKINMNQHKLKNSQLLNY